MQRSRGRRDREGSVTGGVESLSDSRGWGAVVPTAGF